MIFVIIMRFKSSFDKNFGRELNFYYYQDIITNLNDGSAEIWTTISLKMNVFSAKYVYTLFKYNRLKLDYNYN